MRLVNAVRTLMACGRPKNLAIGEVVRAFGLTREETIKLIRLV